MKQMTKFINTNSNVDFDHPEILILDDPFRHPTPKALDIDKTSSFLKQYSQVVLDT